MASLWGRSGADHLTVRAEMSERRRALQETRPIAPTSCGRPAPAAGHWCCWRSAWLLLIPLADAAVGDRWKDQDFPGGGPSMLTKNIVSAVVVCWSVSGCSAYQLWFGEKHPRINYTNLATSDGKPVGAVMAWAPNYNGAFISRSGKPCVQGADVFRSTSGSVDVSAGLIAMLGKLDVSNPGEKALAVQITESVTALRTSTAQSTYLSIGMFGICVLAAGNDLGPDHMVQMVQQLLEASSRLPYAAGNAVVAAPGAASAPSGAASRATQ